MSKEVKLFFLQEEEKKEKDFGLELILCVVEKIKGRIQALIQALFANSRLKENYPGLYQDENGVWRMQDEEKLREKILASVQVNQQD